VHGYNMGMQVGIVADVDLRVCADRGSGLVFGSQVAYVLNLQRYIQALLVVSTRPLYVRTRLTSALLGIRCLSIETTAECPMLIRHKMPGAFPSRNSITEGKYSTEPNLHGMPRRNSVHAKSPTRSSRADL